MKKIYLYSLLALSLTACSDDTYTNDSANTEQPNDVQGRRTVLVYMAAQNSLGKSPFYQRQDSTEIMNGRQFIGKDDRMLMFVDDHLAPRLYRITQSCTEPILLKKWEKDFCSTNPKNFEAVLNFVKQSVPAREYGLVMWSHADGWIPACDKDYEKYEEKVNTVPQTLSFGIDSGPNGKMSNQGANMEVEDLAAAISRTGIHCKFIFFDACLMQNLEVAYALRHVTDYLVAAPIATPAPGSYYTHDIEKGFFADDPSQIARTYLEDVQSPALSGSYYDYGLCISAIRTDRLEHLAQTLKAALPHSTLMNRNSPEMIVSDIDDSDKTHDVLNYQAFSSHYFYRPHNYDALQSLRCILPTPHYKKVKTALEDIITFHGSTASFWIGPGYNTFQKVPVHSGDFCGISMFIPQTIYTDVAKNPKYSDLNEDFKATEWYEATGFDVTGW